MSRGERRSNCGGAEFVDATVGPRPVDAGATKPRPFALPRGHIFVAVHLEDLEAALAHHRLAIVAVTPEAAALRRGAAHVPPTFSLRKLVAVQQRVNQVANDPSFVHPFTAEQLAIMSYALGALSSQRIAAGERLDDPEEPA